MLGLILLSTCFVFFIAAFCLYHFMLFQVNKHLALDEKFPHSLLFGQRDELSAMYKSLYPKSIVYQLTLVCRNNDASCDCLCCFANLELCGGQATVN
jgi:hypothetical protein